MKPTRNLNKVVSPRKSQSVSKDDAQPTLSANESDISRGGVATPFPWKLHEMLDASYEEGNEWIVSWQPHGRSFTVHKPKIFVEKIMPTYFNQSKYASFQRQLNLYGFSRLTSGKDKGAYYHSCFVRGQPDLCRGMIRQKIKGTKVRRTLAPEEEPDLYAESSLVTPSAGNGAMDDQNKKRWRAVRQALAQTENIFGDDVFGGDNGNGPLVSPMESEESDSEDSQLSQVCKPVEEPKTMLPPLEGGGMKSEIQPLPTKITSRARRLSSGDLLFFEGKPFHYLEHLDSIPPLPLPKQSDLNKDSSCGYPRYTLQSLMRADPHALMGAALNVCQIP